MEPLTFVTVVFEAELTMLRLQARSLARFSPADLTARVLVVDNSRRGLARPYVEALLAEYGPLADRVRVVRGVELDPARARGGWHGQQVLKLAVAREVPTSTYVALDAKNHAIGPLTPESWRAPDGRLLLPAYSYATHPHRPSLERTLRYVGLEPEAHLEHFPATVTPYPLDRDAVLALMADVEQRSGGPFGAEFLRAGVTEFFLYAGWLLAHEGTLEARYALTEQNAAVLWPSATAPERVRELVARSPEPPFFAVHRNALARLGDEAADAVAGMWRDVGLTADVAEGRRLLADMTREARPPALRRLATRGRAAARRVLGR